MEEPDLPAHTGRTAVYSVQYKVDLGDAAFGKLDAMSISDAGQERIITDLDGTAATKFYRVEITKP